METAETLAKALEELQLNGWCKNAFESLKGEHCALGAILKVVDGSVQWHRVHDESPVIQALYKAIPHKTIVQIESKCGTISMSVVVIALYNNNYCESIDDIFDWFTRAKEFC